MTNQDLQTYIQKAQANKTPDETIKNNLTKQGWPEEMVRVALIGEQELTVPKPPNDLKSAQIDQVTSTSSTLLDSHEQGLKTRVFEYNIMFLNLWVAAFAMFWIINAFIFTADSSVIAFPLTALLVTLPLFLLMLFRIRSLEKKDPDIKRIAARIHLVQTTQGLAFIMLLIHTIFALYQILHGSDSTAQQLASWLGTLVVFGGIFWYYWVEAHKGTDA